MRFKDFVFAISSGLLLYLSYPKINFEPLAFCAFLPLLLALKERGIRQTFQLSMLCGLIFNLMLFNWVVVVMRNYGRLSLPLSLLLLFFLACYLGLYVAVTFTVARFIEKKGGLRMTVTLPFLWVFFEYCKSHLLTGFPWENLGYSQYLSLPLIQVADITGVYGISFLIILCNTFFFSLFISWKERKKILWFEVAVTFILFCLVLFYGYARIEDVKEKVKNGKVMKVKLIQPNIEQALKWDPAYQKETLTILESLSLTGTGDVPELIIWPEAATPFYFQLKDFYATRVMNIFRQAHAFFLFGSPAFTVERSEIKYFNSAFLISPQGEVLGRYDKIHLVPFGEYVPLQKLLFFVHKMVEDIGDFSPGEQPGVLSFHGKSMGVLICYEIIFPEIARMCVQQGSSFLVNITNDAWFGKTSAPYQHNSMATLRAIENRVFVVRAANTGITSIIDPTGRITSSTELFTPAVVTGKIFLIKISTFYNRYGDIFAVLCSVISVAFFSGCLMKRDSGLMTRDEGKLIISRTPNP